MADEKLSAQLLET